MKDEMKFIFGQVHADEGLKDRTRAFLAQKTRGYTRRTAGTPYRICAAACLVCLLIGGYRFFIVPTAEISIDINPSFELGVNRFDRVVTLNGYNDDGQVLADEFDIKFMAYTDALDRILDSERIVSLLGDDEVMTITVTGPDGAQSSSILSGLESRTAAQENTYCYFAHADDVAHAHEMGMSHGKYRAYLELQALDPDITPEVVQSMTMREIRDCTNRLLADHGAESPPGHHHGNGHRGNGRGYQGGRQWAQQE